MCVFPPADQQQGKMSEIWFYTDLNVHQIFSLEGV